MKNAAALERTADGVRERAVFSSRGA